MGRFYLTHKGIEIIKKVAAHFGYYEDHPLDGAYCEWEYGDYVTWLEGTGFRIQEDGCFGSYNYTARELKVFLECLAKRHTLGIEYSDIMNELYRYEDSLDDDPVQMETFLIFKTKGYGPDNVRIKL